MNCSRRPTASPIFHVPTSKSCFLRAALMIRNTDGLDLDPGVKETLCGVAVEMEPAKSELIKTIIRDWLE
jgi:hypothetical protein